jgi:hypothetical protein
MIICNLKRKTKMDYTYFERHEFNLQIGLVLTKMDCLYLRNKKGVPGHKATEWKQRMIGK